VTDQQPARAPSRFPGTAPKRDYQPRHKTTLVKVTGTVHGRLTARLSIMMSRRGRRVTYSEVIEQLLDQAEAREGEGQ
jgi:hypothetical protein